PHGVLRLCVGKHFRLENRTGLQSAAELIDQGTEGSRPLRLRIAREPTTLNLSRSPQSKRDPANRDDSPRPRQSLELQFNELREMAIVSRGLNQPDRHRDRTGLGLELPLQFMETQTDAIHLRQEFS